METRLDIELDLARSEMVKLRDENYQLRELVEAQKREIISLREQLEMGEDEE